MFMVLGAQWMLDLGEQFGRAGVALWLGALMGTLVSCPLQFIYRYNVLCARHKLTSSLMLVIFLLALSFCFAHGFAALYCFDGPSRRWNELLGTHPMYARKSLVYLAGDPVGQHERDGVKFDLQHQNSPFVHFLMGQALVLVSYTVICWSGRAVSRRLRHEQAHMTTRTRGAHRKLGIVMVFQVSVEHQHYLRCHFLY